MSQGLDLRRGGFQAPRVPFDLRCVILAAFGYVIVWGLDRLLGSTWVFDTRSPVAQLVSLIAT
ncbi:MAG: hypothetical protein OER88_10205, partial [Planctomycetota bacterium]|nr:hypothetical protein [Planctomycetota bacterium]